MFDKSNVCTTQNALQGKRSVPLEINVLLVYQNAMTLTVWLRRERVTSPQFPTKRSSIRTNSRNCLSYAENSKKYERQRSDILEHCCALKRNTPFWIMIDTLLDPSDSVVAFWYIHFQWERCVCLEASRCRGSCSAFCVVHTVDLSNICIKLYAKTAWQKW